VRRRGRHGVREGIADFDVCDFSHVRAEVPDLTGQQLSLFLVDDDEAAGGLSGDDAESHVGVPVEPRFDFGPAGAAFGERLPAGVSVDLVEHAGVRALLSGLERQDCPPSVEVADGLL